MKFNTLLALATVFLLSQIGPRLLAEDNNKPFLGNYEKVRSALAADNLVEAKKASLDLGESGQTLAQSETLTSARGAFANLSDEAIKSASGQAGYYIMHCPMLKKDWVQTSKTVSNPYGGKAMLTCGELKN